MKPSQVQCPRCFAPRGRPCVTEAGIGRPIHAERFERARQRTQEAIEAGEEPAEIRSNRFEEDERVNLAPGDAEALAETGVEQLREIIESAEMDDSTGELVITARTPEGVEITERLQSFAELHAFVREFGFDPESELEEWGFGYGGPIKLRKSETDTLLAEMDTADLFAETRLTGTKLFRVNSGILLPTVRIELAGINEELIKYLAKHPNQLYSLDSRKFEELVEAIFKDFGYETTLTQSSKDGGFDIRAIRKDSVGTLLCLIECKRRSPDIPIGVDIVRGLYGVTATEHASCGLIVTTSHFTSGAKEFARKNQYQVSLREYADLVGWLKQYPTSRNR
jgi:HJR/Mrr/RecB family endonuclease